MRTHLLLLGAALTALPMLAGARSLGDLEFEACTLAPESVPVAIEAFCTTVTVPEDHDAPDGRSIELALAWVPARDSAAADPVFMLAGGPGQSARDSYPGIAQAFADVRRQRHVLLLDQRGTGESNPLVCDMEAMLEMDLGEEPESEAMRQSAADCLAEIGDRADVRFYSTTDAIRDLDLVRQRIGADQVNLVGISYGTRVAQQFAARFPDHTRAIVIDGVVPNTLVLGADHARNLENALALQFARCTEDAACSDALGDPRAHLDALMALADGDDAPLVSYRDPRTAELHEERLSRGHVAAVVRMFAYSPATAALLPLTLNEAIQGRPEPLMAQARLLVSSLTQQINHGMQLSVMCTEDAAEMAPNEADADSVLGNALVEVSQAQCAVWPTNPRPEGFRDPLAGELPVLLLSGELDPVTPPAYGEEVAATLPNGRHLVLAGQGHNVLGVGCAPKLIARFLDTLDAAELDAECLDGLSAPPPFSGFHGWEP